MMNCGYDPQPDGTYDVAPIAPQAWHAYHIAGEQIVMGLLGALVHRARTGEGQGLSCAIHEAVSKNTELDLMNWIMRRAPLHRQTCRHASERVSPVPTILQTKDGRWFVLMLVGPRDRSGVLPFLERYGMAGSVASIVEAQEPGRTRAIPGARGAGENDARLLEAVQRLFRKFTFDSAPWREAQAAGLICVPLRRPHENVEDDHWQARGTFSEVEHPELGRSLTYVTSRWVSDQGWVAGRRAPRLDEDRDEILAELDRHRPRRAPVPVPTDASGSPTDRDRGRPGLPREHPRTGKPMALAGVRILDFAWFLASAGGTRFLAAMGAESIKVEWHEHPDTRLGAMAPVGGRAAREKAAEPLPGRHRPRHGRAVQQQERRQTGHLAQRPPSAGDSSWPRSCSGSPTSSPRDSRPACSTSGVWATT